MFAILLFCRFVIYRRNFAAENGNRIKNKAGSLPTLTRAFAVEETIIDLQTFQSIRHFSYTLYKRPHPDFIARRAAEKCRFRAVSPRIIAKLRYEGYKKLSEM